MRIHTDPKKHMQEAWKSQSTTSAALSAHQRAEQQYYTRPLFDRCQSLIDSGTWPLVPPPLTDMDPIRIATELTIADYHATDQRDAFDPTWLRQHKAIPTRSMHLFCDNNRSMVSLRTRMRLNRARTQINVDRGKPLVLETHSACLHCHASGIRVSESISHILMDCPAYASARSRLINRLDRLTAYDPQPILTLDLILGTPHFPAPISHKWALRRQRQYTTLLDILNGFFRSIQSMRLAAGLQAL